MQSRVAVVASVLAAVAAAAIAGDLRPPLVGMEEHADAKKLISMQLPVNWKEESMPGNFGAVVHWSGFFQPPKPDGPDANIEVSAKPTWSRAVLAQWDTHVTSIGKPVDGTLKTGDGWIEEVRRRDDRQQFLLVRLVERHGQVWELTGYSHESIYPHIENHLRALFDTFKAQSAWPAFVPPPGYASSSVDGTTVWTDTKDKKTLKRITDAHAATWAAMAKWLPGDRAIADPPLLVVCDKDATYEQLAKDEGASTSPTCYPDYQRRCLTVRVGAKSNATLDESIHDFAATQYVQYYFGGKVPDWVDRGLAVWSKSAFEAKGKPEKPTNEYIRMAKDAVAARSERFDALLTARRGVLENADLNRFDTAAWAWNCFFRFGAGAKQYGERYAKYLDDLRKSGSPDEAAKAWDGVDFDAIAKEFREWVAAWK